ncbi:MAG TPA: hypothetical protein VE090_06045 [Methylomirabilota bacterium]|nr:hypothetical protein [Methylomirabilota bacterium]
MHELLKTGGESPDRKKTEPIKVGGLTFQKHPSVSIEKLLGTIPPQGNPREQDVYTRLAKADLTVVSVTGTEKQETFVIAPNLNPEHINDVLYFAAPNNAFGRNTEDLIADKEFFEKNPSLQRAHKRIPGWNEFQQQGSPLIEKIALDYKIPYPPGFRNFSGVVVPVLHFGTTEAGASISLTPIEEGSDLHKGLSTVLPKQLNGHELNTLLGPLIVAAYSPGQTQWPPKDSIVAEGKTNVIGPLQTTAYLCRKLVEKKKNPSSVPPNQDIEQSPLIKALDEYAKTRKLP